MTQTVNLKVTMSCGGCVGAVKRVLSKMEGVESFDIDDKQQKVTVKVKDNVTPEAVKTTVSKTGKKTEFWEEQASAGPDAKPSEADASSDQVQQTASEPEKESSPLTENGAVELDAKPSEDVATTAVAT
ncbi:unnamed protein product [Cuscuta epithymum]|uniref:HMA domain-containing protein n=1 Tax=Cuscuta epithymum TaxID=186058 RepID=A0AAV0EEH4_9ASTE|nr:unnamed protein product [Cuscuta epithymum]